MEDRPFLKYKEQGAYHFDWYKNNRPFYRENVDKIVGYFKGKTGSLLDVGCGEGFIAKKIVENSELNVTGTEYDETAINLGLKYCKSNIELGRLKLKQESIYDLDTSVKYDFVLCNGVIEHLQYPNICIDKIYEVIKQFAIIMTPNGKYCKQGKYDYFIWDKKGMDNLFSKYPSNIKYLDKGRLFYLKLSK